MLSTYSSGEIPPPTSNERELCRGILVEYAAAFLDEGLMDSFRDKNPVLLEKLMDESPQLKARFAFGAVYSTVAGTKGENEIVLRDFSTYLFENVHEDILMNMLNIEDIVDSELDAKMKVDFHLQHCLALLRKKEWKSFLRLFKEMEKKVAKGFSVEQMADPKNGLYCATLSSHFSKLQQVVALGSVDEVKAEKLLLDNTFGNFLQDFKEYLTDLQWRHLGAPKLLTLLRGGSVPEEKPEARPGGIDLDQVHQDFHEQTGGTDEEMKNASQMAEEVIDHYHPGQRNPASAAELKKKGKTPTKKKTPAIASPRVRTPKTPQSITNPSKGKKVRKMPQEAAELSRTTSHFVDNVDDPLEAARAISKEAAGRSNAPRASPAIRISIADRISSSLPSQPDRFSDLSDDDDENADQNSAPSTKKRKLPSNEYAPVSPLEGLGGAKTLRKSSVAKKKKAGRVMWEQWEEMNLKRGVQELGEGNWGAILRKYEFQDRRTNVNLKDKWRNILKRQEKGEKCAAHDGH